jgi:uncharacterized protein
VHQDGLVHVSALADKFVKDPREVVRVGQTVKVRVVEVDVARRRIALSMRKDDGAPRASSGAPRNDRRASERPVRSHPIGPRHRDEPRGAMAEAFARLKK